MQAPGGAADCLRYSRRYAREIQKISRSQLWGIQLRAPGQKNLRPDLRANDAPAYHWREEHQIQAIRKPHHSVATQTTGRQKAERYRFWFRPGRLCAPTPQTGI